MKDLELKQEIVEAGYEAVKQLIKVAREDIIKPADDDDSELAADRLKNAAMTKKIAIFDAFEILNRVRQEEEIIKIESGEQEVKKEVSFAETRARKQNANNAPF